MNDDVLSLSWTDAGELNIAMAPDVEGTYRFTAEGLADFAQLVLQAQRELALADLKANPPKAKPAPLGLTLNIGTFATAKAPTVTRFERDERGQIVRSIAEPR